MQYYGAITGGSTAATEVYVTRSAANRKAVADDIEVTVGMEFEEDQIVIT
jgi:hypothetical protein